MASGFYAGAFIGGAFGGLTTHPYGGGGGSMSPGYNTGALVGYKWLVSPWVLGVEGDIDSNSLTQRFSGPSGALGTQVDSIYAVHVRGLVGYRMGDFEPFVAGGLASDYLVQSHQTPNEYIGASSLRAGWTLGAGVDFNVNLPILGASTLRAEYLYEGLPNASYDLGGVPYRTGGGVQYVRVGLISTIDGAKHAPAAMDAPDWSGSFFGAEAGYAGSSISTSGPGGSNAFSARGGLYGIYSGRNWMFGNTMLGFDGSTDFGSVRGSGSQPGVETTRYNEYFVGDVRARAGYALGRFLPYAAVGLGLGDSEQTDAANGNTRGDLFYTAWTLGAGVEYMLTERVAMRAEYDYSRSLGATTTKLDSDTCCSQSRDNQAVRIGLSYFFH